MLPQIQEVPMPYYGQEISMVQALQPLFIAVNELVKRENARQLGWEDSTQTQPVKFVWRS